MTGSTPGGISGTLTERPTGRAAGPPPAEAGAVAAAAAEAKAQSEAAVKEAEANVEMISEGASDVSLNFVVPMSKVVEVVKILHDKYIGVVE